MIVSIWKTFNIYQQAKDQLHPLCFPWDIATILWTGCFWYFGSVWLRTSKMILLSCRKLVFICRQKMKFIPRAFAQILQRYVNLFWVLWAWLLTLIQNDSIILQKTSIFICMQKINFIIHFFLMILHFKESCNLIGWQHSGP